MECVCVDWEEYDNFGVEKWQHHTGIYTFVYK